MSTPSLPEPIAPTSVGDFNETMKTWALGALAATAFALLIFIIMKISGAHTALAIASFPLSWLLAFLAGFLDGPIPEQHNAIAKVFGKQIPLALPDGPSWWPPSWLGFGRSAPVNVVRQRIDVPVGNFENHEGVVYADGRTPVVFNFEVTGHVYDLWRWDVQHAGDPKGFIKPVLERTARWFAGHFQARALVTMESVMSQAIMGEINEIEYNGERVRLPDFGQEKIYADLVITGFAPDRLYVQSVNVPREVAEAWAKEEKEKGERDAERVELAHVTEQAKKMSEELGIPVADAIAIIQAERGKIKVVKVDGRNTGELTAAAAILTSNGRRDT